MTTIAAAVNGARPHEAIGLGAHDPSARDRRRRLSRGQTAAVAMSIAMGVVVAGYGLAGSYLSIADLADRHNVPLAALVPAGIDGGLVAVVVLDLVLTWIGSPVGWLRQFVRVLSVATVAANAVAGWPDPVAVGLHAAAPVMLLAMIEASRTVLLRRIGQAQGTVREPIPPARWLLAPWRTFLLWRRMALWQITSYRVAVDTELQLRRAVTLLRVRYGRRWARRAPADLVWMLRTGVAVDEACERVHALLSVADAANTASGLSSRNASDAVPGAREELPSRTSVKPAPDQLGDPAVRPKIADVERNRLAEAVRLNRQHWVETGRPISAETLRQQLHVSAGTSRELTRAVRAADRAAVIAAGASIPLVDHDSPAAASGDLDRARHAVQVVADLPDGQLPI
jgi:Protein of unknown function (DUF2637)